MTHRLRGSASFEKAFKSLGPEIKKGVKRTLEKFQAAPALAGLNFEPLAGMADFYSIRVNAGYRILLRKDRDAEGDVYTLVNVGPHNIYRKLRKK